MRLFTRFFCLLVIAGLGGCGSEPVPPPPDEDARHVPLEGQSNFRDLGGYRTEDGRTVKSGQIYRTGVLAHLSDEDVSVLKKLKIKTVVNFLGDAEIRDAGKDRLPEAVQEVRYPIDTGDDLAVKILKARRTADFSGVPKELNAEIHRMLMRDAKKEYADLLREIAAPANRPIVFHCSHGVHRTGTGAAILLSALGVPWETVRKDYLLSNRYRKKEIEKRLEQLRQQAAKNQNISPDKVDMTNMNAFYILKAEYIDASLDEAVTKYGSMREYIRKGLGVDDATVEKLRDQLLEPAAGTKSGSGDMRSLIPATEEAEA